MKKTGFVLALLLLPAVSNAEIYKWTDKEGTVHYSDQHHTGAEIIALRPEIIKTKEPSDTQRFPAKPGIPPLPSLNSLIEKRLAAGPEVPPPGAKANKDQPKEHVYTTVNLQSPKDQETITDNNGKVNIQIELVPQLAEGDRLQPLLDGKAFGDPISSGAVTISGVNRGQHTLAVEVQNNKGNTLKTSNSVTFHMRRAYIKK